LATSAHDTADGNDGIAQNVVFTGSEAVFDGVDSRITVPYNPNLSPGSADFTTMVQINTTHKPGTGGTDFDLIRAAPLGKLYKLELFPHSGKSQAQCIYKGSLNHITLHAGPSLNDGVWHTIVCTKTSNQVTLTVDGIQVGSATITIGTITLRKNAIFALGYKPVPGGTDEDFFNGEMRNASVSIS